MAVINSRFFAQRPYILAFAILLILVLWMASGLMQAQEIPPVRDKLAAPVAKVKVQRFNAEPVNDSVELYGRTEPDRITTLKAEVSGQIEQVLAKRGARVSKGQIIAKIAINDLEHQLERAKAQLVQRQLEFDGNKRLNKDGYQGEVQLSQAKAELVSVKAEIKRLEIALANTTIRAPFDGILNTRYVEQGDYVQTGDDIAMIADLDPLIVRAHVTEQQIAQVSVGQNANIRFLTNQNRQGQIRYIASLADESTNTFKLEVAISNADYQLKSGISGEVEIIFEQVPAIKVSPALLALDEVGNVGVKSVQDDHVVFTGIDIVKSESDGIWLTGLGEQADIIVLGQGFVRAGDQVEAVTDSDNQQ